MSTVAETGPRAAGVYWDLSPIVPDGATARARLEEGIAACEAFSLAYRGQVATMDGQALATALADLGRIENLLGRVGSYVGLRRAVDVNDLEARDLEAVVDQGMVRAGNLLRFFQLEWIALDDDRAAELIADPVVAADRHHLESARRYRPHTRSEPEEEMLAERDTAAVTAWQNLFAEVVANVKVPVDTGDGERDHTVDELLSFVHHPTARCGGVRLTRSTPRSSLRRRSSPTATTRSSPTVSCRTGSADTPARWTPGTSRTSSTPVWSRR